jgi:transposase
MCQCTSITGDRPIYISELRQHTCDAEGFLTFVCSLIENDFLTDGDILICDNAKIHVATVIIDRLARALQDCHVRLFLLPTYSPELNPAELVFSQTKSYLRYHRGTQSFDNEIINALATVTTANMESFYEKCIVNFDK